MKKLRVYLDTSVINFLFADDAPDFKSVTKEFFENYSHVYDLFISRTVLLEIARTRDPVHRRRLEQVLQTYPIALLPEDEAAETDRLTAVYIELGVVPRSQVEDAFHVAYATVHELDILLSWNFKHLANVTREARIQEVNRLQGYWRPLRVVSPLEVISENDES